MVKKNKDKQKQAAPKTEPVAEETKAVDAEMSLTVQSKIENDKKIKKQIKQMTAHVNQSYDLKQAVKAVTALQKFVAAQKHANKGLLDEDDEFITLTFTLS